MSRRYRMVIIALVWAWTMTGCTLSSGPIEEPLPQLSGEPQVQISAPLPNSTYLEGVGVNIQITVSNAGADIDRVEVYLDGVLTATLPDPNPMDAPMFGVTQTVKAEGVGAHTIEAQVFRDDGAASPPVSAQFNVIANEPIAPTPTPTNTVAPTLTPSVAPPTQTPTITSVATTSTSETPSAATAVTPSGSPTSTTPLARFEGAVNVRRGPSTNFEPPIGTFNANQTAEVLALNTDGTWLKVRFAGGEGWVFRQIVKTEGPIDSLPRETGPAVPTLAPTNDTYTTPAPTLTPTTATTGGVNLIVVGFELRQNAGTRPVNEIGINEASTAFVRVRNVGDQPASGFFVVLTIVNTDDGGFKLVEAAAVGGLEPGSETLAQIAFTDIAGQNLSKTAVVRVDENNQVAEINEADNASAPINYVLK